MTLVTRTLPLLAPGTRLGGYLAQPEGTGPFPGVVVIHELDGLNEHVMDVARRFAAEGYAALAVDMYAHRDRTRCLLRFIAGAVLNPLGHGAIHDLRRALTYLAQRPEVDAARLGAIGFCMGGGFAIAWACGDNRLKAIAPYYGTNPRPLAAVARSCPVVASYPEQDFTAWQGRKLAAALERHGVPHDVKIYPGARHSFFSDRGGNHDAAAAADSWRRVLAFFDRYVKPAPAAV